MKVALFTMADLPRLDDDDRALVDALAARGIEGAPRVWDADPVDDCVAGVLRNTWDYTEKIDAFLAFVDGARIPLWNPPAIVRWNAHKRYLLDLRSRGVPIVPTTMFAQGFDLRLRDVVPPAWIVVKPAVSAGARRTHLLRSDDAGADATFAALVADGDVLVQPLQEAVRTDGEWSFVFFDRAFSHAVQKTPAPGDFRVQEKHGGTFRGAPAPDDGLQVARACLDAVDGELLYARVDLVRDGSGRFALMELELVEPSLYLAHGAGAAQRCAAAIARRV